MRVMNDQHIAQLEARLEGLIEGAFAQFFGRRVRAQDVALKLARAMEDGLRNSDTDDLRLIAPDHYRIVMHPNAAKALLKQQPQLETTLGEHMVELVTNAGYRLESSPTIQIQADESLGHSVVTVHASHVSSVTETTNAMERVKMPSTEHELRNPQLIVSGRTPIFLKHTLLNIGRNPNNDIVVDDPYISRHHAQLRLRFGRYTLFDVQSRVGTFVNEVRVREHILRPGDVIRLGRTRLVYLEDDSNNPNWTDTGLFGPDDLPDFSAE